MVKWHYKSGMECDATGGRNGGALRTVWEILLEMERFKCQAGERSGSSRLGLGPGEGLGTGQSPCGLGLGDALRFSQEDFAGALRVLRAPEVGAVRRMCGRSRSGP